MKKSDNAIQMHRASLVNDSTSYLHRRCPCCGALSSVDIEIQTPVDAAQLGINELIPRWNGFFKEKSIFAYARCKFCGLLYAPIFFDDTQLADLYAQMPPNMEEVPLSALKATQRGYFEVLQRHSPLTGDFMEVGPDIGLFTENCVREGSFSKYWLLEPNSAVGDKLSSVVQGKPYHIIHEMHGFTQIPEQSVSVAVMVHVLDHLLNPIPMLNELKRTLRPDAILLLVTHNESSLLRRITGSRWPAFCLQHPQIYNPNSIGRVLESAGFDLLEVVSTVNYFEVSFLLKHLFWTMGIRNLTMPSFWHFILGLKLGNMLTVARPSTSVK